MNRTVTQIRAKCPTLPWMIDFHSTEHGKVMNQQLKAASAGTHLEHLINLHPDSKHGKFRLTQFYCTIPPNISEDEILELLQAGMRVAILKNHYFNPIEFNEMITRLRIASADYDKKLGYAYPLAIALDLAEIEIQTGKLGKSSKEVLLKKGEKIWISSDPIYQDRGSKDVIYVNHDLSTMVKTGDSLVLGGGNVNLSALEVAKDIVECVVETAGKLIDNLSVKLLNTPILPQSLIMIESYLKLAQDLDLDLVIVAPHRFKIIREILESNICIFNRIETGQEISDIDSIINDSDGIVIDTDQLLVTMKETVVLAQKMIVARCNKVGKPVTVSFNFNSITRSQIFDLSNAIIDGIDGLLLPSDPDLLDNTNSVCKVAECAVHQRQILEELSQIQLLPVEPIHSVALSAVELSYKSNAAAIITLTTSGRSSILISQFRPRCPIISVTRYERIGRLLRFYKGILPIIQTKISSNWSSDVKMRVQMGVTFGKYFGLIRMGDCIVVVTGSRPGSGFTDTVKVVFASEYDTQNEN